MADFKEVMNEEKAVNKWFISKVFITGMFCGAAMAVVFMWVAVL